MALLFRGPARLGDGAVADTDTDLAEGDEPDAPLTGLDSKANECSVSSAEGLASGRATTTEVWQYGQRAVFPTRSSRPLSDFPQRGHGIVKNMNRSLASRGKLQCFREDQPCQ